MSVDAEDPFFVVGCPRSGTTLLAAALAAHPDLAVLPETFYVRDVFRRLRRLGDPGDDGLWEKVAHAVADRPAFEASGVDREAYLRAVLSGPRRWEEPLRLWFAAFCAHTGAARVGEKTPNHLLAMRTLERWFPGARFVHIVRDPRAVALSWRRVPWSHGDLAADAAIWTKYARHARQKPPRQREQLLTVRFEELVRDPERVLRSVCAHLGVAFHPAVLDPREGSGRLVDVEREPWKAGVLAAIDVDAAAAWERDLTRGEVRRIEAVVWPEMERFGYRPRTPRPLLLARRLMGALRGGRR